MGSDEIVGWVDASRPTINVGRQFGGEVSVPIAIDKSGNPIGVLGPSGFIANAFVSEGRLKPDVAEEILKATHTVSTSPTGAATEPAGG